MDNKELVKLELIKHFSSLVIINEPQPTITEVIDKVDECVNYIFPPKLKTKEKKSWKTAPPPNTTSKKL